MGSAQCQDGRCTAPSCGNPDPNHCTTACTAESGKASCAVVAKDADGDGHLDDRCPVAPGDDCDDHQATVFPGAPEVCDGLDNDCNGRADSFDTLPLGGEISQISTNPETGSVGVTAAGTGLVLERLYQDGYFTWQDAAPRPAYSDVDVFRLDQYGRRIGSTRLGTMKAQNPMMAATSTEVLVLGEWDTGATLMMQRLAIEDGSLLGDLARAPMDSRGGAAVPGLNGNLVLAWSTVADPPALSNVQLATVSLGGVLELAGRLPEQSNTYAMIPSMAVGQSGYAIIWVDESIDKALRVQFTVRWALVEPSFQEGIASGVLDSFSKPITDQFASHLVQLEIRPQVVAAADGYLFGWFDQNDELQVQRVDTKGSAVCGPVPVPSAVNWGFSGSLVPVGADVLAAVTDKDAQGRLLHISPWCGIDTNQPILNRPHTRLGLGTPPPLGTHLTVGQPALTRAVDGGLMAAWIEQSTDTVADGGPAPYRTMVRVMTPNLCQ